jgi:hypothetical protein
MMLARRALRALRGVRGARGAARRRHDQRQQGHRTVRLDRDAACHRRRRGCGHFETNYSRMLLGNSIGLYFALFQ